MNTKKMATSIITAMMVIAIFAVMVGTVSAYEYRIGKETYDADGTKNATARYILGDLVYYRMYFTASETMGCTVDAAKDILPNGTEIPLGLTSVYLSAGDSLWWNGTTYVVDAAGIQQNAEDWIINELDVTGVSDGGEHFEAICTKKSYIDTVCEFDFEFEQACCYKMKFTGSSVGDVTNHTWDFGDGDTLERDNAPEDHIPVVYEYDDCGYYWVTLGGCCDGVYNETKHRIYVDCGPTAYATADPAIIDCGTETTVTFDGSASTGDTNNPESTNPIVSWNWTFSDGSDPMSGETITKPVTIPEGETLTATLNVSDGHCYDEAEVTVRCGGCAIRIYGTFNEGAGDHGVIDDDTELRPENPPYTDPMAPFYPQATQAPRKDFVTFNPAIMDHNQWPPGSPEDPYDELDFYRCSDGVHVERPQEKVFKRMWYEKEWFKDKNENGEWDVVIETPSGLEVMTLDEWNDIPEWEKVCDGLRIVEWNNPEGDNDHIQNADIYAPAIIQEFTYMTLNGDRMPIMVRAGSEILVPMAHDPSVLPYRGLNSFDVDGDGDRDALRVESEATLGLNVDNDPLPLEHMNPDGVPLSNDETVVLVDDDLYMEPGNTIQFFDHKVTLLEVFSEPGLAARFDICDNEGGNPYCTENLMVNVWNGNNDNVKYFYRAREGTDPGTTFYLKLVSADAETDAVVIEVGRMFGQADANIGNNIYWNQKAFMVDGVFYSIAAIMTGPTGVDDGDCFKYMTIRQKLPKFPIKIFSKHLEVWDPNMVLPEMAPHCLPHEIIVDVLDDQMYPPVKVGVKVNSSALAITYVEEEIEERYFGSLLEILGEPCDDCSDDCIWPENYEAWMVEWFHTYPEQYTAFRLPAGQKYLVTLSWRAPEAETTIWNDDPDDPIDWWTGDRVKFWYEDCTGPIYIDRAQESIRIFGTFGEGAGDRTVEDDDADKLRPENPPYTDPIAPFYPQATQAPVKDFMTFNPAIMDHNQWPPGSPEDPYDELDFYRCSDGIQIERPQEKVFKRMWYEKEWFKDKNENGDWDVVIKTPSGLEVWTLEEWNNYPEWLKVVEGLSIVEWNDPEGYHHGDLDRQDADIYAPAIIQEFTYMTLNGDRMPIMVRAGSEILVPMAHNSTIPFSGLNSFDADGDGDRDALRVESEFTLDLNIDQDDLPLEHMNPDGQALSNDETVVLVLGNKYMEAGDTLQFFDHKVTLNQVFGQPGLHALFDVCDNEGGNPTCEENTQIGVGDTVLFYRGRASTNPGTTFYLTLISADASQNKVLIEVGRMFGQADANIGNNIYWNQKAFMVDGVFYSIAAIMTGPTGVDDGDCFKYMTIRQKLPKFPIKIFGKHLEVWDAGEVLPEMAPYCLPHEVIVDVLGDQICPPVKIGEKEPRPPLVITYVEEDIEPRFNGSLLEILGEPCYHPNTGGDVTLVNTQCCLWPHDWEGWMVEWFHTYPEQYTAFKMPKDGDLYLMTLAWYAPEAETTIWNDDPEEPIDWWTGDRAKFWYDPADPTDIYINRMGDGGPGEPDYNDFDANQDCEISITEMGAALDAWYAGSIGMSEMGDVLDLWYQGTYC